LDGYLIRPLSSATLTYDQRKQHSAALAPPVENPMRV
jgi:hypothetical protein